MTDKKMPVKRVNKLLIVGYTLVFIGNT
jgi:hypothetical protein